MADKVCVKLVQAVSMTPKRGVSGAQDFAFVTFHFVILLFKNKQTID